MNGLLHQLLDELDVARYDTLEIVDRLNRLDALDDEQAEEEAFELRQFTSGFEELCEESHNDFLVVRDLDGDLAFIWQRDPRYPGYALGPLYREHLSEPAVDELRERHASAGADDREYLGRVLEVIEHLPRAPGPLTRY